MGQHCAGFPDLLAVRWPLTIWVECKTEAGRLRPEQAAMAESLSAPYVVCRSVEDAQRQAETWRDRADGCRGRW
jgi:hypothetical protein